MKVLVVGGGGREHTLAWALSRSPGVSELWTTAEKNAGLCGIARCVDLTEQGVAALADWAKGQGIDLTVVGPEAYLTVGIADEFRSRGLKIFGPTKAAAEIEGSKVFAKELMAGQGVPTAPFTVCQSAGAALQAARRFGLPVVIKADGLAAGKGVSVCFNWEEVEKAVDQIMVEKVFGEAGAAVVVEAYLEGEEASIHALVDESGFQVMPSSQDHKRVFDNDQGPNTGGMGAYSPAPVAGEPVLEEVSARILRPVLEALAAAGRSFTGALYTGIMMTKEGPQVVEFNCRFGDPETQVLLPRLKTDFLEVLQAAAEQRLAELPLKWRPEHAACVVLCSSGYPGAYKTGYPITGLEEAAALPGVLLFHAATSCQDGVCRTAGGRVIGVTGMGIDLPQALARAYQAAGLISFTGKHYRKDIGARALRK
ncbi:MAG TPA: phosphoribosylamine--glycine ligase [Firmicutes bacterium]|nr:phosphoribosylamine--glycine ligase [Bacillota bacterium]